MPPVQLSPTLLEGTTALYLVNLLDPDDVALPGSTLTSLALTWYDVNTGTILNGRDEQNVLNANNVTVDESGLVTWELRPEDTAILSPDLWYESHRALWEWTWGFPEKVGRHEVDIVIENLDKVP